MAIVAFVLLPVFVNGSIGGGRDNSAGSPASAGAFGSGAAAAAAAAGNAPAAAGTKIGAALRGSANAAAHGAAFAAFAPIDAPMKPAAAAAAAAAPAIAAATSKKFSFANHLVLVAGHAVLNNDHCGVDLLTDAAWVLLDYQRDQGITPRSIDRPTDRPSLSASSSSSPAPPHSPAAFRIPPKTATT